MRLNVVRVLGVYCVVNQALSAECFFFTDGLIRPGSSRLLAMNKSAEKVLGPAFHVRLLKPAVYGRCVFFNPLFGKFRWVLVLNLESECHF